jgi:cyclopropane fatty-acyl-phospholipid synthase-like methyltransferase
MASADLARFVQQYDDLIFDPAARTPYAGTDYFNVGYWAQGVADPVSACERLVEAVLAEFPSHRGSILDVGCGLGAVTSYLTRHYHPARILGINLSEKQIQHCRSRYPDLTFEVMDAASLRLPDGTFDRVLSVEAAFHFRTRAGFLREAHRVLKPGGSIAITDLIPSIPSAIGEWMLPPENRLEDLDAYRALWRDAGFPDPRIRDVTDRCWRSYCSHLERQAAARADRGAMEHFQRLRDSVRHYVIASAGR